MLLEAMASGLPCVAMDCDTGPSELIENGVNGMLVPDGDASAFIKACETLMNHHPVRSRLMAHAVNVRDSHSLDCIAKLWENEWSTYETRS